MIPVESSYLLVDTDRAPDLDSAMEMMERGDDVVPLLGRLDRLPGVGEPARPLGADPRRPRAARGPSPRLRRRPAAARAFAPRSLARVPLTPPSGLLNPVTVAAFNEVWYCKAPTHQVAQPEHMASFFHPLDGVAEWNRLYGRKGFLQYQFVVPFEEQATVRTVVERLSSERLASFLAVLKRFGPADPGPLSFPMPGWTLALDLPIGAERARPAPRRARRTGRRGRRARLLGQGLAPRAVELPGHVPARRGVAHRTTAGGSRRACSSSDLGRRLGLCRPTENGYEARVVVGGRAAKTARGKAEHRCPRHRPRGSRWRPLRGECSVGLVIDAVGQPQSVLVLGGSSEIAQASRRPAGIGAVVGPSCSPGEPVSAYVRPATVRLLPEPRSSRRSSSTRPTSTATVASSTRCSTSSPTSTVVLVAAGGPRRPGRARARPGRDGFVADHQLHRARGRDGRGRGAIATSGTRPSGRPLFGRRRPGPPRKFRLWLFEGRTRRLRSGVGRLVGRQRSVGDDRPARLRDRADDRRIEPRSVPDDAGCGGGRSGQRDRFRAQGGLRPPILRWVFAPMKHLPQSLWRRMPRLKVGAGAALGLGPDGRRPCTRPCTALARDHARADRQPPRSMSSGCTTCRVGTSRDATYTSPPAGRDGQGRWRADCRGSRGSGREGCRGRGYGRTVPADSRTQRFFDGFVVA